MSKRRSRTMARWMAGSVAFTAINPVWAGSIKIETPQKEEAVGGSNIACVAQFNSADKPITRVVFLVDDQELVEKDYKKASSKARVTFVWDATGVTAGSHELTVRALSGDANVGEDHVKVVVSDGDGGILRPQVHIFSPEPNSVVSGDQDVSIFASDPNGVGMVSLFIDRQLKLLQNVPPYRYTWDTTQYANGPHTLEVWAYDRAQAKGEATPVKVFVNNPTGRTELKDIPDEAPTTTPNDDAENFVPAKSVSKNNVALSLSKKTTSKPIAVKPVSTAKPTASKPILAAKPAAHPALVTKPAAHPLFETKSVPKPIAKIAVSPKPSAPSVFAPAAKTRVTPIAQTPKAKPADLSIPDRPTAKISAALSESVHASSVTNANITVKEMTTAPRKISTAAKPVVSPIAKISSEPKIATAPKASSLDEALSASHPAKSDRSASVRPIQHPSIATKSAASPVLSKAVSVARENPILLAKKTGEAGNRNLRPIRPMAPVAAKVESPVAPKVAAPVRIARADTHPAIGAARLQESPVSKASPAAQRVSLAPPPLRLMLGQSLLDFDVQPFIRDGVSIAPLRQIIEHTGGMVMWIPAERKVQAVSNSRHIEVKIGSRQASVDHRAVKMEYPAMLKSGRTMVPVHFLQVALDMKAIYDPSKGLVYLYRK